MKRALAVVVLAAACTSSHGSTAPKPLIVVSAPLTAQPWIGEFLRNGANLAAKDQPVRVEVLDNGGSAQTVVANARQAVSQKAVAFITDGVGARAVAAVTDPAKLAVFITFEGGASLTEPTGTVFRMAPANTYLCRRLADYLADLQANKTLAVLSDDSSYGREGGQTVKADLQHDDVKVVSDQVVPEGARDVSAQVLQARRSGARVLVVWARAAGLASITRAARSTGWDVPIYSGPAAEDPLLRQQLADEPHWLDDVSFVSFRITSEVGGAPFAAYRKVYEKAYGPDKIGVGDVVQPPDWSMYPYDAVNLVAAALKRSGTKDAAGVYDALQNVSITGANGDERGFGPDDREGVSPDDMYFAHFDKMTFVPNKDDKLSTVLPLVPQ